VRDVCQDVCALKVFPQGRYFESSRNGDYVGDQVIRPNRNSSERSVHDGNPLICWNQTNRIAGEF